MLHLSRTSSHSIPHALYWIRILAVLKTTFFPRLFRRRASKCLTYSFMTSLCTIMSSLIVEHPIQALRHMLSDVPLGYFSRWPGLVSKPLLRYKPMCVEKVVMFRELSFNSAWWHPFARHVQVEEHSRTASLIYHIIYGRMLDKSAGYGLIF